MKYTYEFLRKCHGLRFRATLSNKQEEGIIKVEKDGIMLCYGAKDPGRMFIFERTKTLSFTEQTFGILPKDFEIVPRDPETYQDWQAGDVICGSLGNNEIIFRSGEVVVFKYTDNKASNIFTCCELFMRGYRLVLTDIEKQIIEERRQQLFDAMAKEGKRWNAEKKVVEEIPSFKRFDAVLVRDKDDNIWLPKIFLKNEDNKFWVLSFYGDSIYYDQCIPLNKDTEELIGKTKQYYEQ